MRIISLTTDFGHADPYVGIMKAVILRLAGNVTLVDITQGVPPQDVVVGAMMLDAAAAYFPDHTVHLAVVDPGVGTSRRGVAVQGRRHWYVGPDNGLLTLAAERDGVVRAVSLDESAFHLQPVSPTFHGRDVFAPAAAHLASGGPLEALGSTLAELTSLRMPRPVVREGAIEAHVVYADTYGNLVLDVTPEECLRLGAALVFAVNGTAIGGLRNTFADVAEGGLLAYPGSQGRVEIALRNGSAKAALGVVAGQTVLVTTRTA